MDQNWSTQAHQMHKAADSGHKSQVQVDSEIAWLRKGPHIDGDLIVIPSPWPKDAAITFWRDTLGARFDDSTKAWCFGWETAHLRRTCKVGNGKQFTAAQWLVSITKKYNELWATELGKQEVKEPVVASPVIAPIVHPVGEYHPQHHTMGDWR